MFKHENVLFLNKWIGQKNAHSKLIPALVLFLTLDKVTKKLEALLIWERVKYLNRKLKECVSNISQQTFLLNEIEKRMIKKTA
jgi:hypothetical protein